MSTIINCDHCGSFHELYDNMRGLSLVCGKCRNTLTAGGGAHYIYPVVDDASLNEGKQQLILDLCSSVWLSPVSDLSVGAPTVTYYFSWDTLKYKLSFSYDSHDIGRAYDYFCTAIKLEKHLHRMRKAALELSQLPDYTISDTRDQNTTTIIHDVDIDSLIKCLWWNNCVTLTIGDAALDCKNQSIVVTIDDLVVDLKDSQAIMTDEQYVKWQSFVEAFNNIFGPQEDEYDDYE